MRTASRRVLFGIRCVLNLFAVSRRIVSCINHARVPCARPLIKLLSVFVVVGRYFSTASLSFLLLVRSANSRRVQTPSIIARFDPFPPSFLFLHLLLLQIPYRPPFYVLLLSVPHAREIVDVRLVNKCVRCAFFRLKLNYASLRWRVLRLINRPVNIFYFII